MDEETKAVLAALAHEADSLLDQVEDALDEHATQAFQLQTRRQVDDVSTRYRQTCAGMNEDDKMQADRTVGRKVRDVQKMAVRLPAAPSGSAATPAADDAFLGTRAVAASSSRQPRQLGGAGARGEQPRFKVTGTVDAWCGPCDQMRAHTITAIVDELPAQVICDTCGGRHKFREGPARKKGEPEKRAAVTHTPTAGEREAQRKADEKRALVEELRAAEKVRPFDPKERYKAGEIIEHPEHGRGKIENTLPRSLLVRFVVGLRQLKLG
jgi:hypothetical protein